MASARARRSHRGIDYWPGFVDALSTMLLVIIFLLSVFMLSQFFLSREVTGKDTALNKLNRQILELTQLLSLERLGKTDNAASFNALTATLESANRERERLQGQLESTDASSQAQSGKTSAIAGELGAQKESATRALAQIEILNQQITALRRQLSAVEEALGASESKDKESQTRISELGSRLNVALAQKVQELSRYRSDFFGRLRQILGNRPEIRVVGDRFVFQSEVFFDSGQAALNQAGKVELDTLAAAVTDLEREIPPEIPWVLRIDGHTDKKPVTGAGLFKSNWELSSARAISVVQYLMTRNISPQRLVAAGFGEFQPIDTGEGDDALKRNRRIELKLTER